MINKLDTFKKDIIPHLAFDTITTEVDGNITRVVCKKFSTIKTFVFENDVLIGILN